MIIALALVALNATTMSQGNATSAFAKEFAAGAGCARLFQLRNAAKATATPAQFERITAQMRAVACYSTTSTRNDGTVKDGAFTVREYRIHRAIVSAPMTISEKAAIATAAKQHGISAAEAEKISAKVLRELVAKKWLAVPEREIRHAVNWNGERQ